MKKTIVEVKKGNHDLVDATRLEMFSDGVMAVIITIMVLELKAPHGPELADLEPLVPVFFAYVLSFIVIGTYWNNHHHLLRAARIINPRIMWSNLYLLFWLSLIPFFTAWMGENHTESWPTVLYGGVMLMTAFAYQILQSSIVASNGPIFNLKERLGADLKGKLSLLCYISALGLAFINPWFSDLLFAVVALIWFIPDSRLNLNKD